MNSVKVKEALFKSKDEIDSLDAEIILSFILGISREKLFLSSDLELSDNEFAEFEKLKSKRRLLPLAYIIQEKEFFGRKFFVNKDVLIPRPDTEVLASEVIENFEGEKILETGTGSGIIAITLKKELLDSEITAVDISDKALEVAKKNAKNLDAEIDFFKSDLLENIDKFKILVANLPYVRSDEILGEIKSEPKIALDGGKDGFDVYRKLFRQAKKKVSRNSKIFCEIDPRQREIFSTEAENHFPNSKIIFKKDLSGKIRVGEIFLK